MTMPEFATKADIERLEGKVDKVADAIHHLLVIDERQSQQAIRIGQLEQRVEALEVENLNLNTKLNAWVNRGLGVWGLAVVVFTLWQATKAP